MVLWHCTKFGNSNQILAGLTVQFTAVFRLDALALSVIAIATWLGGWLSHSGILSKRLNLWENFFDHLKASSF